MNVTIVLAHPWQGSFNWSIYKTVVEALEARGKTCVTIDLNKDSFDPVMREGDLALFSKGESADPLVKNYQEILLSSDELVFIFPIWWFGLPAILKGFFDKVMLKGFAYESGKVGLKGLLTNIRKVTIVTTSESPTIYIKLFKRNPIKNVLIKGTLNIAGMQNVRWFNNGRTVSGSKKSREAYLDKLNSYFSSD